MFNNRNILHIISSLSAIEKVFDYTKQFENPTELLNANNQMNFNGTITLLIAIAEEIKSIEKDLLKSEINIEWQNISDMRNILAHDYRGIDPEIVYDVIRFELPKLKLAFLNMLKEFPSQLISPIVETNQYLHLKKIVFVS